VSGILKPLQKLHKHGIRRKQPNIRKLRLIHTGRVTDQKAEPYMSPPLSLNNARGKEGGYDSLFFMDYVMIGALFS
jgi:hypothetical protein